MSFRNLRIIATAGVAAASIVASTGAAPAREYRKPIEMEPLHHDNDHEIIFEMEPLHPVKRAAPVAPVAAPEEARQAAPVKTAEPKSAEAKASAPEAKDAKSAKAAKTAKNGAAARPAPVNARDVAPKAAEAKPAEQPKAAQQMKPVEQGAPRALTPPTPAETPQPAPAQLAAPKVEEAPKDALKDAPKDASKDAPKPAEAAPVAAAPEQAPVTEPAPVANNARASTASEQPASSPAPLPAPLPAPVADGSQPVPLPLDEALHPQAKTAAEPPAANKDAPAPAPATEQASSAQAAATAPAQPRSDAPAQPSAAPEAAASAPQAAPGEAAPPAAEAPALDSAARIGKLLGEGMKGPVEIRIADRATMFLPAGRTYVADGAAQELAKLAGFDWRPTMRGLIAPTGDRLNWLAPVEVLEEGYIKSDMPLDADKLLGAFGAGLPEVNAQRVKGGQSEVELAGWLTPPALDQAKHRVSACVNVATKGGDADKYFNCEAWTLGRDGAIKVSLAESATEGDRLKGEAAQLAETVVFDHGRTYEEIDVAADRIAPYTVADLLTSDVTAKAAAAPAAEEGGEGLGDNALLITLVALLGGSAALFWLRRQKAAAPLAPKPASARQPATAREPAQGGEPSSLFARLLPSLHAKFARKSAEPPATPATPVYQTAAAAPEPASAPDAGLLGKIAGLRNRSADAAQPAAAPADNREAASALQMLATRMRRTAPAEEPVEKVDVTRALRTASRSLPGAAPEPVAPVVAPPVMAPVVAPPVMTPAVAPVAPPPAASSTTSPVMSPAPAVEARANAALEMPAPAVMPEPRPAPAAPAPSRDMRAGVASDDSFGLVEPGDTEATSAAMHARETLRQANG